MRKHVKTIRYVNATILALAVVTIPLASYYPLVGSILIPEDPFTVQGQTKERARRDHRNLRRQRRAYDNAMEDCIDQRAAGEDIECPDINNRDAYKEYLNVRKKPTLVHSSAFDELGDRDQALLTQYVNLGYCPARLASRGLYRFCQDMLGSFDTGAPSGFLNDRMATELKKAIEQPQTLRARIQQVRDSYGTSGTRNTGRSHYQSR